MPSCNISHDTLAPYFNYYTVVREIFACNNFGMLKFRTGKFSYNNGCSKFESAKCDFSVNILFVRYIRKEQGVHACHGGVRKGLLYSRYHVYKETWRAAIGEESLGSTATDHLLDLAVCSSNRS